MEIIKFNNWPESQICMDCVYGEFFSSNRTYQSSNYICHHPDKEEQDEQCPHMDHCFYCGREGTDFEDHGGHNWCGRDDCHPKEDFFDKADRLYEQNQDL